MKKFLVLALLSLAVSSEAAVRRVEIPGGWYGEARVDGKYAVLVRGSHVQTDTGRVELPDHQNVLFLRTTPTGPFVFGGQDHAGRGNLEYRNGAWRLVGDSYGVNPVIYDWNGVLHQGALAFGSQGFRYATLANQLVTGDATYADSSRRIWEYTTYGDITIGQGEAGCIALRGAERRMLEPGDCRFVRYTRINDALAVTMVKQPQNKTILLWFNAADLSGFPSESVPTTPPPPVPAPDAPPPPPQMAMPDAVLASLREERQRCPSPGLECAARVINFAAWVHRAEGWKLYPKPGGNNCPQPVTGVRISCDILIWQPKGLWFDVLGDVEGSTALPTSPPVGQPVGDALIVEPVNPGGVVPEPQPEPQPPSADLEAIIQALMERVGALEAALGQTNARIDALPPNGVPEDRVIALIENAFSRAVVQGQTSSGLWHSHSINLPVILQR